MARLPKLKLKLGRNLLAWLGYGVFFVLCFVLFAYWSFPYDRVADYLEQEVASRTAGAKGRAARPPMQLSIGELRPHWLTGVEATDVTMLRAPEDSTGTATELKIDSVTARASLLSLLVGNLSISYDAQVGAGTLSGSYASSGAAQDLELELDSVDLGAVGAGGFIGLPVKGVASGKVQLALAEEPKETEGQIDLTVRKLQLGDGKAKFKVPGMRDGFTIETVDAGKLKLKAEVEGGVAQIAELATDGKDLKLSGSGSVRLAHPVRSSRLNATLELNFTDAYRGKSDRTKALFQLMEMQPKLKRAMTKDKGLRFTLKGSLGNPRSTPAGRTRPETGAGRKKRAARQK